VLNDVTKFSSEHLENLDIIGMRFSFLAQDKKGTLLRGSVEARDRKEVTDLLVSKGLVPLQVAEAEGKKIKSIKGGKLPLFFSGGLTTFDQIIITRHLGTILNTGTDILTAVDIIAEDAIKPLIKRILADIKSRVATGESVSQALAAWKQYFSPILINLVRAGEASGNLASVLLNYSQELRKDYVFSRKVRGAMFYPAILISALFGMMLLMLTIVIPRLKELFKTTGFQPPLYTKIMFAVSDLWLKNTVPLLIAMAAFGLFLYFGLRDPRLRRRLGNILWYLPYLNKIQRNATLLRFSKTLAALIKAGFPLKSALLVTGDAVGLKYQQVIVKIANENLERGITLSDSLKQHQKLFPRILISLVATGEKSGQLDSVLSQMAEFYEEEVIYALEQFLTIIEPVLIVIVGIIVGLMVGSLISPIYRFIGRF